MKRYILISTLLLLMLAPARTQSQIQELDYNILCELQQRRTPTADFIMQWTSNTLYLTPAVPAGLLIGGFSNDSEQLKFAGTATGISCLTAVAVMEGIKNTVRRPRPFRKYPDDLIPVKPTFGYSFPSGHTSVTFALATSLSLCYPKWYVIAPSVLWASSVAFSRLYIGVHYPSDVAVGVVVGTSSAVFGYFLAKRLMKENPETTLKGFTVPFVIKF